MKSNKMWVVYCLQSDDSWRSVYTSTKREKCVKYVKSYDNHYTFKIVLEVNSYDRHHGFDYEID